MITKSHLQNKIKYFEKNYNLSSFDNLLHYYLKTNFRRYDYYVNMIIINYLFFYKVLSPVDIKVYLQDDFSVHIYNIENKLDSLDCIASVLIGGNRGKEYFLKEEKHKKKCAICGKVFYNPYKERFCSYECRCEYKKRREV